VQHGVDAGKQPIERCAITYVRLVNTTPTGDTQGTFSNIAIALRYQFDWA
jgi:hypothetical protein